MKNRIAEFRRQTGVTQEQLAAAVFVSRQTVISLENEKYTASLPLAFKIARYFGVRIEDIFLHEFDSEDRN